MAVNFNVPASPKRSVITIDEFLGCDFTNSPASADMNKSPNCVNMIRDVPGKVRKCMGYETVDEYNSASKFCFEKDIIVGGDETVVVWEGANGAFAEIKGNQIRFGTEKSGYVGFLAHIGREYYNTDVVDQYRETATYSNVRKYLKTEPETAINRIDILVASMYSPFDLTIGVEFHDNDPRTTDWITLRLPDNYNNQTHKVDVEYYPINGYHKLHNDEYALIHAGNYILRNNEVLYDVANNARSKSWEFDDKLYIIDGKKFLRFWLDEPVSDYKFGRYKYENDVVIKKPFGLRIIQYSSSMYALELTQEYTTGGGYFWVNHEKTEIIYYDEIYNVGDEIEYYCSWRYKKKSNSSWVTDTIGTHTIVGISDQPEYKIAPVEDDAYIPLVTISKDPEGGGEPYEDLNLLTNAFKEQFLGKASVKDYCLSFDGLDEVEPIAEVLDNNGEWQELAYGVDYTCDYPTGVISFSTAPGVSPVTGEDNVRITAYRTVQEYTDRINKCSIGALFGVNGALDRLFLSGNPDYINYDWYSQRYDPTYFADTSYSMLGTSGSAIVGYSIISNYLATHKDKNERDQNIILREGDLVESEPSFRIINTLQGAGAVAPFSFAYLSTEPLFLTEQGIYAVTAQDITGEKYAQNRSFFLDGKLLEEPNLDQAYGIVYNDMYWLCLNNVAYILDGLQPIQTDRQKPYATRQYVGFYRTNLPANVMWEDNKRLFFGTTDGKVCRFFNEKYELSSYNDNGETIECVWDTPDIVGKLFFKNKTLRHVAVKLDSAHSASVNIYILNRGLWQFIRKDTVHAKYFQFSKIVFSKFSFSPDKTQHTIPSKVRVKKVDKFRLRLTNDELNESFALYNIGFEYIESNNYKG